MRVSTRGEYGVRAVFDLALHLDQRLIPKADIAARQSIPESYLAQLLTVLRRAGYVRSVRGPGGGHALAKRPRDISVKEVLHLFEGSSEGINGRARLPDLPPSDPVLGELWQDVGRAVDAVLTSVTFEDLGERYRQQLRTVSYSI
jgi:Rrf2 family protein